MGAVRTDYAPDAACEAAASSSQPRQAATAARPAAAAAAAPPGQRTQHQGPPLSPLVESVLASPNLERPQGTDPKQFLRVMDAFWSAMKDPASQAPPAPAVVRRQPGARLAAPPEFDVAVAGGTLGILLALALQLRGHRVAVIERRRLEGRDQEWNIGTCELQKLVACGLLSQQELATCVVSRFGPVRVGFNGAAPLDCGPDILDCGVSPRLLLGLLRGKFLAAGGQLLEGTAFKSAVVTDDGVELALLPGRLAAPGIQPGDVNRPMALDGAPVDVHSIGSSSKGASEPPRRSLTARLLVDCMGHYSPVVRQLRAGQRPDGVVLVVGGCWAGFPPASNAAADLLATFTDADDDQQLLWEAFPAAGGGRTAYMFAYTDAHPSRPSFGQLLDTYLRLLPQYQGVPLEQLQPQRILMGGFPCYEGSPLRPGWDRVLQVGDAAGSQSPLSFGGFGSLVRHLPRLVAGVSEALQEGRLSRGDLAWLAPYQPSLSATFLLQRAMAPKPGQLAAPSNGSGGGSSASASNASSGSSGSSNGTGAARGGWLPRDHVNRLLRANFSVLRWLGPAAMRPFLQDTLQFWPLALTMAGMMFRDPVCIARVLVQLGPRLLLSWFGHFAALAAYSLAHALLAPLRPLAARSWHARRLLDALEYGSGRDNNGRHAHAAADAAAAARGGQPAA